MKISLEEYSTSNYVVCLDESPWYKCGICGFSTSKIRHKLEIVRAHIFKTHVINNEFASEKEIGFPVITNFFVLADELTKQRKKRKRRRPKPIKKYLLKPWKDKESLFCDGDFLKRLLGKEIAGCEEIRDSS